MEPEDFQSIPDEDADEELSLEERAESGAGAEAEAAELGLDMTPPEFYDPNADDRDEHWTAKHRRGHKSDAVLSCPLCFTTLCIDCQQHARYENQFRAMFVMNCKVMTKEVVRIPVKPTRQKRRRQQEEQQQPGQPPGALPPPQQAQQPQQGAAAGTAAEGGGEVLHPVQCAECGTEVALRDGEGVYHFINVFASNA